MASRISCSGASAVRTSRPQKARTAAMVSKSSGSAMAMVRTFSTKATGMARHWRRKRCDMPSISGAEGGTPSTATRGTSSWSLRAARTSRWATVPMSTRILPRSEGMAHEFDFGGGRGTAIDGDEGDVELVAEGGENVAVGDGAHVDEDFADLVAALQLKFEGALDILGVDLAAFQQDLAEAHVAGTKGVVFGPGVFGLGMRGEGGGHYRSSVSTLAAVA